MTKDNSQLARFKQALLEALLFQRLARNLAKTHNQKFDISQDFLILHDYAYMKLSIIEVAKLVGNAKKESISIYKLLNKFNEFIKTQNKEDKTILKNIYNDLLHQLKLKNETISKVIDLRDKIYAHSDSNFSANKYNDLSFFDEILMLLEVVQKIFTTICYIQYKNEVIENPLSFTTVIEQQLNQILIKHKID